MAVSAFGLNTRGILQTIPPTTKSLDETQTLSLQAVAIAVADGEPDEPDDGCRIEKVGFKRIV
jgi:hypothetical protein